MSTPTPYQESSSSVTLPEPCPTQPVAGRPVDSDTPVFDWTPVPDAAHYRIQIASTEAFDSIHYDETAGRGSAISLRSVLPDEVTAPCWRVRAEGEEDAVSDWSDPAHFAVSSAEQEGEEEALRVEAPPVPLQPDGRRDTPVNPQAVSFSWEEVPEASGYQLQVASDEDFADPVVDLTVDQTTSVTLYDVFSSGDASFSWRIRPLFRVADPGPWSTPVSFTLTPPSEEDEEFAPEAADPQASARAAGPVTQARTSRAFSLTVSLLALLSFIATIVLIIVSG